ncbi:MAG: signal transduction histidine kinase [Cognaticolwellia sp.]
MKPRSLRSWLLLSHGLSLLLAIIALMGTGLLAWDLRMQTKGELIAQGEVLSLWVRSERLSHPDQDLGELGIGVKLAEAAARTRSQVQLLDNTGVVRASSGGVTGQDLSELPEVQAALSGDHGTTVRGRTDEKVFQAIPVRVEGDLVAVLLLQRSPRGALQALYHMRPKLGWSLLFALLAAGISALLAARLSSRSLTDLADAAVHLAEGNFQAAEELRAARSSRVEEVARLSNAMGQLSTRLQDRLAYIGEFAGHVSHEFKTPLATLRGTVELLSEDNEMPPEQRARFLANANTEVLRLERLVTGLLELARAEEQTGFETVDLQALVQRVAARHDVPVHTKPAQVSGALAQLDAALENLVQNAKTHGAGPFSVHLWREGKHHHIEVRDVGAGISLSNQARVFERFFTTRRGGGGTGLGLALVQSVALAHAGEVTLSSTPGDTRVRISLRCQP